MMQNKLFFLALGVIPLLLTGCKEEKVATYSHPKLGIVTADHPEYLNAHRLCDEKIYGQGFEIAGKIYTSKATVFEQIQPILVKAQKTKDDADLLQKWAGVVQPAFIDCVKQEGFEFVKNDQ